MSGLYAGGGTNKIMADCLWDAWILRKERAGWSRKRTEDEHRYEAPKGSLLDASGHVRLSVRSRNHIETIRELPDLLISQGPFQFLGVAGLDDQSLGFLTFRR